MIKFGMDRENGKMVGIIGSGRGGKASVDDLMDKVSRGEIDVVVENSVPNLPKVSVENLYKERHPADKGRPKWWNNR